MFVIRSEPEPDPACCLSPESWSPSELPCRPDFNSTNITNSPTLSKSKIMWSWWCLECLEVWNLESGIWIFLAGLTATDQSLKSEVAIMSCHHVSWVTMSVMTCVMCPLWWQFSSISVCKCQCQFVLTITIRLQYWILSWFLDLMFNEFSSMIVWLASDACSCPVHVRIKGSDSVGLWLWLASGID